MGSRNRACEVGGRGWRGREKEGEGKRVNERIMTKYLYFVVICMLNDKSKRNKKAMQFTCESYGVREDVYEILLYQYRYLIDEKFLTTETKEQGKVSRFAVRKQRLKWEKQGLIRRAYLYSPVAWVWSSQDALDLFGYPFKERKPSIDRLNHYHAENLVRLYLEHKNRVEGHPIIWKSERQIRKEQPKDSHAADGVAISHDGREVAIEVELSQKNTADIDNILEQLAYRYEHIVYFSHPRVYNFVNQRLKRLNPVDKAKFTNASLSVVPYIEVD